MAWKRILIKCEPAQPGHDIATAWLADAGCSMFEEDEHGLAAFAREEDLDAETLGATRQDLAALGLVDWIETEVEEENWNAQWERDYEEVRVGQSIRVRAPFHPEKVGAAFDCTLTIQPRMAFGTGHHGTTRGLLAEMVGMEWRGQSVLDMGCGSGVLGIYAAIQGAGEVVAVDIDPWSVRNTEENLTLNGLASGPVFDVREGGAAVLTEVDTDRFDVVIANINRNILLADMAAYAATLKSPGMLMLSGFMQPDVATLEAAAEEFGLTRSNLREEAEWRVLTLRR